MEALKLGSQVYYTGDVCNPSAWFTVAEVCISPTGVRYYNLVNRDDVSDARGAVMCAHIGRVYNGTCAIRYVTGEAYAAYGERQVAELREWHDRMFTPKA